MYHGLLRDSKLYLFLYRIDCELADSIMRASCPTCSGGLHRANYPRKARGAACTLGPEYDRRKSFCCGQPGCRKRTTPPSVRFLGRKVYLGAVIVLCAAMQHGLQSGRAQQLWELLGVSRQTLRRWRTYWQQTFVQTPFWKQARAFLSPPVAEGELPGSLLSRFAGELMSQLVLLLRFVAPVTTESAGQKGAGF